MPEEISGIPGPCMGATGQCPRCSPHPQKLWKWFRGLSVVSNSQTRWGPADFVRELKLLEQPRQESVRSFSPELFKVFNFTTYLYQNNFFTN